MGPFGSTAAAKAASSQGNAMYGSRTKSGRCPDKDTTTRPLCPNLDSRCTVACRSILHMPHATAGLLLLTALACASAETVSVDAAGNAKAAESSAETCGAGDDQGKCGFDDGSGSYASVETGRGAGTDKVSTCGEWCAGAEANAPCAIDTTVMPCKGEYWCTTTCALWTVSILEAATPAARASQSAAEASTLLVTLPTSFAAFFNDFHTASVPFVPLGASARICLLYTSPSPRDS